jgi:hypothetical protein
MSVLLSTNFIPFRQVIVNMHHVRPKIGTFKLQAEDWKICKSDVNVLCGTGNAVAGNNCGYDACASHDDCRGESEYCSSEGMS